MISARSLPVLVVLGWATLASAAGGAALEAELTWTEARGSGEVQVTGAAWAWNIAAPLRSSGDTPVEGAWLSIEGESVALRLDYVDYKGTTAGRLDTDPEGEPRKHETIVKSGSLSLAGIRPHASMLGTGADGSAGPEIGLSAESAVARRTDEQQASLLATGAGEEHPLQRTTDVPAGSLQLALPTTPRAFEATGDFVLYLWETDLRDPAGNLYQSGDLNSKGPGAGVGTFQDGVVYDSRAQVMTVTVTAGRMTMFVPERAPNVFLSAEGTQLMGSGGWDLLDATGSLHWGGADVDVADQSVRLVGDLTAVVNSASDAGFSSSWTGRVTEVTAGPAPMELSGIETTQPAAKRSFLWAIPLGIALLGAGGGAFLVVQRRHGAAATAAGAPVPVDHEALLAAAVEKLQSGKAAEVAAELEGSFDEAHDAAPFQAYVLALAHLKLDDREAAADWFLAAARLYPHFAKELTVNDSLRALRDHARVRAELGLVEDSVAYV